MSDAIYGWIDIISSSISSNLWFAPLLALLAGVLTSFLPCSLSTVPLVIGYVGGTSGKDAKKAFRLSLLFAIGMALTLTALGVAASLLGKLLIGAGSWWYIVLGVLMLLMALQTFEIFNFIPATYAMGKNTRKGYIGAFLAGILGGLFSSPCATPMLIVLLAYVAKEGNLFMGTILLLLYSLGHSVLVLIAGTSIGFVTKITKSEKYGVLSKVLRILLGSLILLLGFYMFYLGF